MCTMANHKFDKELDVRQEEYPYPSHRTNDVLNKMDVGQVLRVLVGTYGSVENIRDQLSKGRWLNLEVTEDMNGWIIFIERVETPEGLGDWVQSMVDDMSEQTPKKQKKRKNQG